MPDINQTLSGTEVKISELPVADQANASDMLEASQGDAPSLVSRSITLDQVATLVAASDQITDVIDTAIGDIPPPPPNDWASITGKPSTFPPTLPIAQSGVTNLVSDLALKAPLASPALTGVPTAPNADINDDTTQIATTHVVNQKLGSQLFFFAPKDSPVFTGNPTAPTPTAGDNDTSIATTAFVTAALASGASISVGLTPPVSPAANQLWFYNDGTAGGGQIFIYYNDGNTTQWVPASPGAAPLPAAQQDGVLRLYSEQVLSVAGNVLAVTIPPLAKMVKLEWGTNTVGAVDDTIYLQMMQSGVPLTTASYETQRLFGIATTAGSATANSLIGWLVNDGLTSHGEFTTTWLPSTFGGTQVMYGHSQAMQVSAGGNRVARIGGHYYNGAVPGGLSSVTGFRLTPVTNNFTVGSYLRSFVVT